MNAGSSRRACLWWLARTVSIAMLASLGGLRAPAAAELPDTIDRVRPSIVAIGTVQATRRPPGRFVATGFVVGDGRHVITNAHAIPEEIDEAGKEFLAVLIGGDGGQTRPAQVLASDRDHDLALLRMTGKPVPALRLADSSRVREGQFFAFSGFPIGMVLGLRPVTHRGMISAITPIAIPQLGTGSLDVGMIRRLRKPYDVFQLDATAYPGNSGSPLYDMTSGEVVGVINKVFVQSTKEKVLQDPSGISYAIPSAYVLELMKRAGVANR